MKEGLKEMKKLLEEIEAKDEEVVIGVVVIITRDLGGTSHVYVNAGFHDMVNYSEVAMAYMELMKTAHMLEEIKFRKEVKG